MSTLGVDTPVIAATRQGVLLGDNGTRGGALTVASVLGLIAAGDLPLAGTTPGAVKFDPAGPLVVDTSGQVGLNLAVMRTVLKLALPVFRAENYGAKFDGTTDDSAAWRALMVDVAAKGTAVSIRLPAGISLLQGEILDLPSGTSIIGEGQGVSELRWFGTDAQQTGAWFIDISGSGPDVQSRANCLLDFRIAGGPAGGKGPAVRAYYTAHSVMDNLYFDSWNYGAIWGAQLWDTRISKVQGNFCGVGVDRAAIWLRNSAAASGTFGFSNDTTNQVFISDVRFEDSFGNDLRLEEGTGSTTHYPMNGIYVTRFKGESNHRLSRSSIYVGPNVTVSSFTELYLYSAHFSPYFASSNYAAHYGVENRGGGRNHFGQVYCGANDAGMMAAAVLQASTGVDHLEDVTYESPNGAPTSGNLVVIAPGTVQPLFTGLFSSAPVVTTLIGGGSGVYAASNVVLPGSIKNTDGSLVTDNSGATSVNGTAVGALAALTASSGVGLVGADTSGNAGLLTLAALLAWELSQQTDLTKASVATNLASGDQVLILRGGVPMLADKSLFGSVADSSGGAGTGATSPGSSTNMTMSGATYAARGDGSGKQMLVAGSGAVSVALPANGNFFVLVGVKGGTDFSYADSPLFMSLTNASGVVIGAKFFNRFAVAMNSSGTGSDPAPTSLTDGGVHNLAFESVSGTTQNQGMYNLYLDSNAANGGRPGNYGPNDATGTCTLMIQAGTQPKVCAGLFDIRVFAGTVSSPGAQLGRWPFDGSGVSA